MTNTLGTSQVTNFCENATMRARSPVVPVQRANCKDFGQEGHVQNHLRALRLRPGFSTCFQIDPLPIGLARPRSEPSQSLGVGHSAQETGSQQKSEVEESSCPGRPVRARDSSRETSAVMIRPDGFDGFQCDVSDEAIHSYHEKLCLLPVHFRKRVECVEHLNYHLDSSCTMVTLKTKAASRNYDNFQNPSQI